LLQDWLTNIFSSFYRYLFVRGERCTTAKLHIFNFSFSIDFSCKVTEHGLPLLQKCLKLLAVIVAGDTTRVKHTTNMTDDQLIKQFQVVEDNFNQALTTNNVDKISKYVSEEWILLVPQFGIITKDRFLHVIEQGDLSHTAMNKQVLRVKLYNDIAIVTARGMNIGFLKDEPFNAEHWATNAYKKENENWICIYDTRGTCNL